MRRLTDTIENLRQQKLKAGSQSPYITVSMIRMDRASARPTNLSDLALRWDRPGRPESLYDLWLVRRPVDLFRLPGVCQQYRGV